MTCDCIILVAVADTTSCGLHRHSMDPVSAPRHSEGVAVNSGTEMPRGYQVVDTGRKWLMVLLLSFLSFPTRQFFLIKTYIFWQIPRIYIIISVFSQKSECKLYLDASYLRRWLYICAELPFIPIVFHCLICTTLICLWTGSNAIY